MALSLQMLGEGKVCFLPPKALQAKVVMAEKGEAAMEADEGAVPAEGSVETVVAAA